MFEDISPRYDFLNHFLSFGVDLYWRRQLVKGLTLEKGQHVLDVATGTGDVGFAILKRYTDAAVIGLDYAFNMTLLAREKARRRQTGNITFVQGDGEALPFRDNSFDALTISYGFRNIGHYEVAAREFQRVLKPGGKLAILEFSQPRSKLFGHLYRFYFKQVLPRLAGLFSQSRAYRYLPESVEVFPPDREVAGMLVHAGFSTVEVQSLTFGVSKIYWAVNADQ